MKNLFRRFLLISIIIVLGLCFNCKIEANTKIVKHERGILFENDSLKIKIEFISPQIVHITSSLEKFSKSESLIISEINEAVPFLMVNELTEKINIKSDSLLVSLSLNSGKLKFYNKDKLLLSESSHRFISSKSSQTSTPKIEQGFDSSNEEALYGLGQHQNGIYNYKGKSVELVQDNSEVAVPFIVSTNSYGILWDNYSRTIFADDSSVMSFKSDIGDQIDYYFIYGSNIDKIIKEYRVLTGQVPLYPKWAYGFFQSRNRYWTQKELLGVVKKFRECAIPLDVIVLDYLHWGKYGFGSFQFDESFFPNPEEMINTLHNKLNCKLMVSLWPSFTKDTPNWKLMKDKGYLLDVNSYKNTQVYDPYNPLAGKQYWNLIKNSYGKIGVDGWWLDATEPEKMSEYKNSNNFLGSSERYLNTFSLIDVKNIYEGARSSIPIKRVFILTRSSFAGQQKYASATWSGDIGTTFDVLKNQVSSGLNFCLSGIPYWTSDIGGYKGGDPEDKAYRELYVRWFQYGTFCPIFRSHGRRAPGDRKTPNEIWSYGNKAETILTNFLNLRYRLMPYIYSEAWKVYYEGSTIMRALVFDFQNDKHVYDIKDQFMFGHSLLINPVVNAGVAERKVYLPLAEGWFDFWTGESFDSGKIYKVNTPIEKIPIFVKSGSIIPMGPFIQYSTEKPSDPIELRIYGNENAELTLYEDENDNYNYEQGIYSTINIKWNSERKTLTLGERVGEFPGMQVEKTFNVIVVSPQHGVGIEVESNIDKIVHYTGEKIVVSIK